jgi:hypothetical protein
MEVSIEVLYDWISNITIADYKMDQSPKPILHSVDLRMNYLPDSMSRFWVDGLA